MNNFSSSANAGIGRQYPRINGDYIWSDPSFDQYIQHHGYRQSPFSQTQDSIDPQRLLAQNQPPQQYQTSADLQMSGAHGIESALNDACESEDTSAICDSMASRQSPASSDDQMSNQAYAAELYACLIGAAPRYEMRLQDIYAWFRENSPRCRFSKDEKAWKNSIRHNLSMNNGFRSGSRNDPSAKYMWRLSDEVILEGRIQPTTRFRKQDRRGPRRPPSPGPTSAKQKSGSKGGRATRNGARRNLSRDLHDQVNTLASEPSSLVWPSNCDAPYALSPWATDAYGEVNQSVLGFGSDSTLYPGSIYQPVQASQNDLSRQAQGEFLVQADGQQSNGNGTLVAYPRQDLTYDPTPYVYPPSVLSSPSVDSIYPPNGYQGPVSSLGERGTQESFEQPADQCFDNTTEHIDPNLDGTYDPSYPHQNMQFYSR